MRRLIGLISLICLLAACAPEATPVPVDLPTPTENPALIPTAASAVRYGFAPNTSGLIADFEAITNGHVVVNVAESGSAAELGAQYDIVVAYGVWEGWAQSPTTPHIALLVNTSIAPLDDESIATLVRRSIDTIAVVSAMGIPGTSPSSTDSLPARDIRTELANRGEPDGLDLALAYAHTPGYNAIADQLSTAGIATRLINAEPANIADLFTSGQAHLALVAWINDEGRGAWASLVGTDNIIDLYAVPISYTAVPDLSVTFTPAGWPIVAWRVE